MAFPRWSPFSRSVLFFAAFGTILAFSGSSAHSRKAVTSAVPAAGPSGYHLIKTIKVGGDGFWDYWAFDSPTRRLFISRGTRVTVVDVDSGKIVGEIPDTPGVHGIALAPDRGTGFTSNGMAGTISIFDLKSLQVTGHAQAEMNPDSIAYDTATKRVFAMNGHPCKDPSGLAIDAQHRRLFAGCANKMMAVINADSGKVIATPPIGAGVDSNQFDPGTGLAFASRQRHTDRRSRRLAGSIQRGRRCADRAGCANDGTGFDDPRGLSRHRTVCAACADTG